MKLKQYKDFIYEAEEFDILDELDDEFDSITLSDRLKNRLLTLKKGQSSKISVGDVIVKNDKGDGKLPKHAIDFLNKKKRFKVLRMNDKGKLDLGCSEVYRRESDNKKIRKVFYFSPNRFMKTDNLDPVSQFILSLEDIEKKNLIDTPLDFLDVDMKGNFTFLSRRFVEPGTDSFKSAKRQPAGLNKILNRIVTKEYYDTNLKSRDIELFLNQWRALFDTSLNARVLEGNDILDVYNRELMSDGWKHSSCAAFNSLKSADVNKFKVFTENPQVKALAIYSKGKIQGRRLMFDGIQSETHGKYKKGDHVKILNNFYGEGGSGSKVDQVMLEWAKDNGVGHVGGGYGGGMGRGSGGVKDIFRIKLDNTRFPSFPPIDIFYVNFKTNEVSYPNPGGAGWQQMYGARCPKDLLVKSKVSSIFKKDKEEPTED